jgi:hypothetical protein
MGTTERKNYLIGYYPYGNNGVRYENNLAIGANSKECAKNYYKSIDEMIEIVTSEWKCDCFVMDYDTEEIVHSHKY